MNLGIGTFFAGLIQALQNPYQPLTDNAVTKLVLLHMQKKCIYYEVCTKCIWILDIKYLEQFLWMNCSSRLFAGIPMIFA